MSPLALVRVPYRHGDLLAAGGDYPDEWDRLVPIRPICEMLGIDHKTQTRKLRQGPWANWGHMPSVGPGANWGHMPSVAADGRRRLMACLPLRELLAWLGGISARRVAPGVREILWALQLEVVPLLLRHFLPSAPPAPPPELPPVPMQSAPLPSAALLRARDMEAIEDELLFLKTQAGRLEAHAGLREPVRYAIGELFERVERLEGRLGLALVAPAWRSGGDAGPEEHHEGDVDPELGALRVAVRQMRDQVEGMKGCIGVAPGDELPNPVVVAPRETVATTPSRVRAFLLERTEALESDVRGMRSRKPVGMTASELAVAYDAWAEQRGIPTLGAHALAQQLANLDTPRAQYRRRFYFAVRLRAVVPTA